MSRKHRRDDVRPDVLKPSTLDDSCLAKAVESRFIELCEVHLRIRGTKINIPKSLDADIMRWRQMRARHKRGDLKNTDSEIASVRTIAQWTVDMICELRNQPKKTLEWA